MKTLMTIVATLVLSACGGGEDAVPTVATMTPQAAQQQADAQMAANQAAVAALVADSRMHADPRIANDAPVTALGADKKHGDPLIYNVQDVSPAAQAARKTAQMAVLIMSGDTCNVCGRNTGSVSGHW